MPLLSCFTYYSFTMKYEGKLSLFFQNQLLHLIAVVVFLVVFFQLLKIPEFVKGEYLGYSTYFWFIVTVGNAIVHQVYVWLFWRLELHFQLLTRTLGKSAFPLFSFFFFVLIVLRPILITILAISNRNSFHLNLLISIVLLILLSIPSLYTFYSVHRYFGMKRAFGLDHFDKSFGSVPFVKGGIFRYTSNAMYKCGFLALWIPGILFNSYASLASALFHHAYIWVHYYCTEKPDIEIIYGQD